MENYTVKVTISQDDVEERTIPYLAKLKFYFNDFEFGSHCHDFDFFKKEDIIELISAMKENKSYFKIYKEVCNDYIIIKIKNGIITFQTCNFFNETKLRIQVNDSLINTYCKILEFYID